MVGVGGPKSASYDLDLAQAANATTIAAVGKRLGLPDHAVTIAIAVALLESKLHNLSYGDRDSLGLFQQRPSQGWGTPAQIMTPRYAATAFYAHLVKVRGWEQLPVTVAAQRVQRSALPSGYAQEEGKGRALASALTGEVAAGMTCHVKRPAAAAAHNLQEALSAEVGRPSTDVAVTPARGWTVALWLVGHATEFGITGVRFNGQAWTAARGTWRPDPTAGLTVAFTSTRQ